MTNNKLYARDDYLKKKAADSNGLNIQLTNNYAFRKTFKNTYIAKGFLMALLGLKENEIADLKVTDPFEEGESEQEKEGILDVKIYLNNNKKINIEMQNRYQNDWTERSLFYNCRMFTDGFYHGQSYGELEPCIHIGILDFRTPYRPYGLFEVRTDFLYTSRRSVIYESPIRHFKVQKVQGACHQPHRSPQRAHQGAVRQQPGYRHEPEPLQPSSGAAAGQVPGRSRPHDSRRPLPCPQGQRAGGGGSCHRQPGVFQGQDQPRDQGVLCVRPEIFGGQTVPGYLSLCCCPHGRENAPPAPLFCAPDC